MSDHFDADGLERAFAARGASAALFLAREAMHRKHWDSAIHQLRRALGSDPDSAEGHALLSICLTNSNRLFAAEHEARRALSLEPELGLAHLADASVLVGTRKLADARAAFERLIALEPENVSAFLGLAQLARLQGDRAEQRRRLEQALTIDPVDESVLVELGTFHLVERNWAEAERFAREAQNVATDAPEVLVLLGHLALQRGNVDEARDHALWALEQNAIDPPALALLASIQSRQSPLLGLWWRYSVWMQSKGDRGQIVILLVAWLVVQVLEQVFKDVGWPGGATAISMLWFGVAVYSWVGPSLFVRALRRELEQVRLKSTF